MISFCAKEEFIPLRYKTCSKTGYRCYPLGARENSEAIKPLRGKHWLSSSGIAADTIFKGVTL